jgi:hypothetical protein
MSKYQILTSEGSLLFPLLKNKFFFFLKNDPLNHYLWKPTKKQTNLNTTKKLELLKLRFLSK